MTPVVVILLRLLAGVFTPASHRTSNMLLVSIFADR
jgi:hypothetical protein